MNLNKDIIARLKKAGAIIEDGRPRDLVGTGSYALNRVMSGKYSVGAPCPGILEFSGESSTAKTLFMSHVFAEAQKLGWYTKLDDAEQTWDKEFAKKQGVDPDLLLRNEPTTVEDAFKSMEDTVLAIREFDKETPIVIGLDSLAVLPTINESESKDYNQSETLGMIRAKVTGGCLRKLYSFAKKYHVLFIIINQIRSKMASKYGSPDTRASGGKSLEFYLSVAMKTISNKTSDVIVNDLGKKIGIKGKIRNTKNKIAVPFQECEFELMFETGLNPTAGLLTLLVMDEIVEHEKGSSWYTYNTKKFYKKDFDDLLLDKSCTEFDGLRTILETQ